MPIKIRCRCGQGFQAPDKLAGKKVRCPKCGNPLLIPAPEREPEASPDAGGRDMSALLDEIGVETTPDGGKRCPQCNVTLAGTAVFCVGCGFHLETQEYVYSPDEQVTKDGLPQRKSFGNPLLDKAAKEMDYDKQQALVSTDPRSWYSYIVGLTLVLVFMTVGAIISMNLTAEEEKSDSTDQVT